MGTFPASGEGESSCPGCCTAAQVQQGRFDQPTAPATCPNKALRHSTGAVRKRRGGLRLRLPLVPRRCRARGGAPRCGTCPRGHGHTRRGLCGGGGHLAPSAATRRRSERPPAGCARGAAVAAAPSVRSEADNYWRNGNSRAASPTTGNSASPARKLTHSILSRSKYAPDGTTLSRAPTR